MKTLTPFRLTALVLVALASVAAAHARTLVAYYSFTGNVRSIVGELQQQVDADVIEVLPAEEGLDYAANNYAIGSSLIAAIREHPDQASSYPAIKPVRVDMAAYDRVIIATPLWWSQMAAPMQTFLFQYGPAMAGKRVGLIVSSASSGISGVVADAKRLVPDGDFAEPSLWIRSSQTSSAATLVRDWLADIAWDTDTEQAQIRVSDGTHTVTFALNATSAAQSLLAMLPISVDVSNYSNNEKIFYPPTPITFGDDCIEGDCPAGTLALFSPWGNVVMYYGPASRYSGLYILGQAVDGADQIQHLSGTITVERVVAGTEAPRGDVNGDYIVDIDDVNTLINIILHRD